MPGFFWFCGAGEIRTLVQTWYSVCFYMLSFRLIVGKGKAGCLPIPFSVVAVSYWPGATTDQPVPYFGVPGANATERYVSGTKAELILN